MPMENQLAHAITQTEYDLSYDKAAKKLLANKQILAQIMKNCVNEYSACSVDEIAEKYIEGTPEVGTVGVHVDDTNRPQKTSDVIVGSNNEDSTLTEGTINYDVRFDAIAPTSEDSTAQKDVIRLIINVEAQTAFNPGYPLTKRAIYYCSRMISAQHGPIFTNSEYGKIRKVYSIWVCMQAPKKIGNAISEYSIKKQDIISGLPDRPESYDKLSVVIIALNETMETNDELLGMLNTLFSEQKTYLEKKKELEEIYQMRMDNQLGKEMNLMCNLSDLVIERGIEQGIESGIEQKSYNLAQMMIREAEPTDKIMRYTGYSLEKIKEIAQEMGKVWPLA